MLNTRLNRAFILMLTLLVLAACAAPQNTAATEVGDSASANIAEGTLEAVGENPAEERLTAEQVASDIALARETYERLHPGYTRYATADALTRGWQNIVAKARDNDGMSLGELYLNVNEVLTLIRCDHTKAELPPSISKDRDVTPVYFPARLDLVERRGFVRVAAQGSGLQVRDEIIRIDGRDFADLLEAVETYVPNDGYTTWSRESGLTESLEFKGGAVDHFGALLFEVTPVATVTVRRHGDPSGSAPLETLSVNRITHPEWLDLKADGVGAFEGIPAASAANFKNAVHYARIDDNTAYLRVDTFVNYRDPVDPVSMYKPVFEKLQASGAETLILDLRQNGGGSNDAQSGLMAHFIDQDTPVFNEMRVSTLDLDGLREHLWTWDKRALKPNRLGFRKNDDGTYSMRAFVSDDLKATKPQLPRFGGRLLALTSHSNSSGVTNLLSVLKGRANMTMVGEKTGGSSEGPTAGLLFTLTLPASGIKTRVPFFRHFNNVQNFEPGLGVSPDVPARQTVTDYLNGVDTALTKAIELAGRVR